MNINKKYVQKRDYIHLNPIRTLNLKESLKISWGEKV